MRNKIIFGFIVGVPLIGILLYVGGYYPQATINGAWVFKKDIDFELASVNRVAHTYQTLIQKDVGDLTKQGELKRLVIEKIIEDTLVAQTTHENPALENAAKEKMIAALDQFKNYETDDLNQVSKVMYGMSFKEAKEKVLLPQARIDVIREKYAGATSTSNLETEQTIGMFLQELKSNADIKFYFIPFRWDKEKLAAVQK